VATLADVALPDPADAPAAWPGEYLAVAGTSVYVRTTPPARRGGIDAVPDPQPALYLHGLAGSSTNWTDLAYLLSPWLAGTAIDLPGFGRSGPAPDGRYSIGRFARVVIAYLESRRERTGGGPVHLFGNSMGGAVSIEVAARRPDLIRTLTLISPAVPDLRPRQRAAADPRAALLLVPGRVSALVERQLEAIDPRDRAVGLLELCFADPARVPPDRLAEAVSELALRQPLPWAQSAFTRSLRAIARYWLTLGPRGAWAALARVRAPTLVVWGDTDRLVDVALAPRTARAVADARLLVLPGVGHTAQLEEPRLTARAFLALWAEADERRATAATGGERGPSEPGAMPNNL
jgi:pimeloyl-ACP methyl ester carboxylesterase